MATSNDASAKGSSPKSVSTKVASGTVRRAISSPPAAPSTPVPARPSPRARAAPEPVPVPRSRTRSPGRSAARRTTSAATTASEGAMLAAEFAAGAEKPATALSGGAVTERGKSRVARHEALDAVHRLHDLLVGGRVADADVPGTRRPEGGPGHHRHALLAEQLLGKRLVVHASPGYIGGAGGG